MSDGDVASKIIPFLKDAMKSDFTPEDELLFLALGGSGEIGMIATTGNVPIGYYKDPEKTRQTFVTDTRGRRYSIPGDFATVEPDAAAVDALLLQAWLKLKPEAME